MASPTQRTWVWVSSGSWWWTGKPGVLQSMGSQRVGHDWATELNWLCIKCLPTQLQRTEGQSFFFFLIPFRLTVSVDYALRSLHFPTNGAFQRGLECCQQDLVWTLKSAGLKGGERTDETRNVQMEGVKTRWWVYFKNSGWGIPWWSSG